MLVEREIEHVQRLERFRLIVREAPEEALQARSMSAQMQFPTSHDTNTPRHTFAV